MTDFQHFNCLTVDRPDMPYFTEPAATNSFILKQTLVLQLSNSLSNFHCLSMSGIPYNSQTSSEGSQVQPSPPVARTCQGSGGLPGPILD